MFGNLHHRPSASRPTILAPLDSPLVWNYPYLMFFTGPNLTWNDADRHRVGISAASSDMERRPTRELDVGLRLRLTRPTSYRLRGLMRPGNRLEALKGRRRGQWSIRINDQWRICFEWPEGSPGPGNVEIVVSPHVPTCVGSRDAIGQARSKRSSGKYFASRSSPAYACPSIPSAREMRALVCPTARLASRVIRCQVTVLMNFATLRPPVYRAAPWWAGCGSVPRTCRRR